MSRVSIAPGTIRDVTYVAANLRDEDRREILATVDLDCASRAGWLSWAVSGPDWCWTAQIDGQPVVAFGIGEGSPFQPQIRTAWAFGTERLRRVVPAITRFAKEEWPKRLIPIGVRRVEIRSIADHDVAHRWLEAIGARRECVMRSYGVHGEDFALWAFLDEDWKQCV